MSTARTPKTLDVTDQQKLLEALLKIGSPSKTNRKGIRNYLIGCLMLDAGLRVGEVVKLGVADMWFKDSPVTSLVVQQTIAKNHRERIIPVSARLNLAIGHMYFAWWHNNLTSLTNYAFFTSNPGKTISTRQVENIIKSAAMKSLGRPVNPHMLRHTYASQLMRVTSMRTVQELLGHNHITSTQVYTHPNEEDKKKAMLDVERYMSLSPDERMKESGPHPLSDHLETPCRHPLHQGLPSCPDERAADFPHGIHGFSNTE